MLRRLIAALLLLCAVPAQADRLRQFHHETAMPFESILKALEQRFPRQIGRIAPNAAALAYSGTSVPLGLVVFLTDTFQTLPADALSPGKPVSLSLTLHGQDTGTVISLMVMARFPDPLVPILPGSQIVLDGTGTGDCTGQMVLAHSASRAKTARIYRARMESEGFAFTHAAEDETSFFIGHGQDCEITLYFQSHGDATMVVIRYLEE